MLRTKVARSKKCQLQKKTGKTHSSIKCSKRSAMIEFPFLWALNTEDTTNHLNKPEVINFKGEKLRPH